MKNEKLAEQALLASEILRTGCEWEYRSPHSYPEWRKEHRTENCPLYRVGNGFEIRLASKSEPAFTLPPPPPGMRWHRKDGWKEGDLPQGWRPLVYGEKITTDDECRSFDQTIWQKRTIIFDDEFDGAQDRKHAHHRTKRPLTLTYEGKEWTWHRVGDPMPCDSGRVVHALVKHGEIVSVIKDAIAAILSWEKNSAIIGWRYAEPVMVPLGPEDIFPGSVVRHPDDTVECWMLPSWVNNKGVGSPKGFCDFEDLLAKKALINRSSPLTGKWNPDAWESCCKPQT